MASLIEIARGELGVKESPPKSNNVKYNTWYYGREVSGSAYPWCMVFVQWCCDRAGVKPPVKTASCGALLNAARKAGEAVYSGYRPGDVVIYDFDGDGGTDHCGIVESVSGSTVIAIEGNTSVGSDSDGGEVMRRTRNLYQICGAWRPEVEEMTQTQFNEMMNNYLADLAKQEPAAWSAEARAWAEDTGLIQGDGTGMQYKSFCTREQMVIFLRRLYEMLS